MKAWFISDTHQKHGFLDIPLDGVDAVIFCGDATNKKNPYENEHELLNFIEWFKSLHYKHKIFVPGNHDTSFEQGLVTRADFGDGIIILEHEPLVLEGIKFFGSPYVPTFGRNWAYNVDRDRIEKYWDAVPDDTEVLITHGPPRGILDLTQYDSRAGSTSKSFFQCGCESLLKRVMKIKPKFHVFGHIHSEFRCPNSGILKVSHCDTTFINASVSAFNVDDNNGFIVDL